MKRLPAIGIAITLVAGLSGCGNDTTETVAGCSVDTFKSASGPVDVTIWHSYVGAIKNALDAIAAKYNTSQDKVRIKMENQGASYEQLLAKYQQAVTSGDLPAVTIGEDVDTRYMIESKTVVPASACVEADTDPRAKYDEFLPAVRNFYSSAGTQYAAAFNSSTILLYYNKAHFRDAGLDPEKAPTTFEEMYQAARSLKAKFPDKIPFTMKMDSWFIEHWLTGAGQPLVDQNNGRDALATKALLDNPTTRAILEWLKKMNDEGLLNAVAGTDGQINHYLAVATGRSSVLLETSAAIVTIDGILRGTFKAEDLGQGDNPAVKAFEGVKLDLEVGVAPNIGVEKPASGAVGGGAWYMTNKVSPEVQSAAWDFIKYYNETAQQVTWTVDGSYLPAKSSAANDPQIQSLFAGSDKGKWLKTALTVVQGINPDLPGAQIGAYDQYRNSVKSMLERLTITKDGAPIDQLVSDATKSIDTAIANFNASV